MFTPGGQACCMIGICRMHASVWQAARQRLASHAVLKPRMTKLATGSLGTCLLYEPRRQPVMAACALHRVTSG